MTKAQRIIDRCPRFYKAWEEDSALAILVNAISSELDKAEDSLTAQMQAHWVDTAKAEDLDKIGQIVGLKRNANEDDAHFRVHLKRAVDEYKGGGTKSAILNEFNAFLAEDEIEIIENPEADASAEFVVIANDTWTLGSSSIQNEKISLSLTVEEEGVVSNPKITNVDTGESITYKGELKVGEELIIQEGSARLGEKDVSEKVVPLKLPVLLRKGSVWKYSEALLEGIGIFDKGKFDENTFAIGVPNVKVGYQWTRRQPATFLVKAKGEALTRNGLTEQFVNYRLNYLRAAGVKVIIKVTE
jgi:hypothetical protein